MDQPGETSEVKVTIVPEKNAFSKRTSKAAITSVAAISLAILIFLAIYFLRVQACYLVIALPLSIVVAGMTGIMALTERHQSKRGKILAKIGLILSMLVMIPVGIYGIRFMISVLSASAARDIGTLFGN